MPSMFLVVEPSSTSLDLDTLRAFRVLAVAAGDAEARTTTILEEGRMATIFIILIELGLADDWNGRVCDGELI